MSGKLSVYTDDDFLDGFLNLLPDGPVWPKTPTVGNDAPVLVQTSRALIKGYTRNAASGQSLLQDAFPVTPVMLLPEWEETLGLPDPCAGESPLISDRQAQVHARFVGYGGNMSKEFYIGFAKNLGYDITITEFAPFRAGRSKAGTPIYGIDWAHVWQVNAPQFTISYFVAGDQAGSPLASWGSTALQCELQRLSPAQTALIFNYS